MDEFSDEMLKCIGWLYVGMLPHYMMANVPSAEVLAMQHAKAAVRKLAAAGELRPLAAAFEVSMKK